MRMQRQLILNIPVPFDTPRVVHHTIHIVACAYLATDTVQDECHCSGRRVNATEARRHGQSILEVLADQVDGVLKGVLPPLAFYSPEDVVDPVE